VEAVKLGGDEAGGGVKDQGNRRGVVWRVTEKDADTGAILPLVVGVLGLKGGSEDIDRRAKGMEVGKGGVDGGPREAGEGRTDVRRADDVAVDGGWGGVLGREAVANVAVVLECGGPQ